MGIDSQPRSQLAALPGIIHQFDAVVDPGERVTVSSA
jgi:hypothetical protein